MLSIKFCLNNAKSFWEKNNPSGLWPPSLKRYARRIKKSKNPSQYIREGFRMFYTISLKTFATCQVAFTFFQDLRTSPFESNKKVERMTHCTIFP